MPVTLAQAALNATDDIDVNVIDEFRKESAILDALIFDDVVNPAGGGSTLTYGYTRLVSQPTAAFRAINSEYTPSEVTKERKTTDLKVLGGSFQIDRVLAGIARGAEVTLQMQQKIKATRTKFQDEVINGDTAVDAEGFDGLDKILTGTDTEMNADGTLTTSNWTDLDAAGAAHQALDLLDEFLALMDGSPTIVLGNRSALAKVRGLARRSSQYVREPVEGLIGAGGRPVFRETYGGVLFVDPGEKPGTNDPIIPIYDPDNAVWLVTESPGADGGTFQLEVSVDGGAFEETTALDWDSTTAEVDAAIEALDSVPAGGVAVTGTAGVAYTLTFGGGLAGRDVTVRVSDQSVTDGGIQEDVTVAESGNVGGLTDLYAVRVGLDGFHGLSTVGGQLVQTWLPDFTKAGAVKTGEVEMGPVGVALKATKAAAVLRRVRVR